MRKLENKHLIVQISDTGAELCSIYDKEKGRELLWQADPKYWNRHSPLLFPNVGKQYNDEYQHNGKKYQSIKHGFARDAEFFCAEQNDLQVVHVLRSSEETKKIYPFDFVLAVRHILHGNIIRVQWEVSNCGKEKMYFTIGGHPAFRVPLEEGEKQSDYKLVFHEKEELEYCLVDIPTGTAHVDKKYKLKLENSMCPIEKNMFEKDAYVFDDKQIEWVGLAGPDDKTFISMKCCNFPNFGIWNIPGAPYVCLEPWIGRCDNFGFTGEIADKPGITELDIFEVFEAEYFIQIHD